MALETVAKKRLYQYLKELGYVYKTQAMEGKHGLGVYYPHPASQMGNAGAPDVYLFSRGRVVFIECKSTVGKMTAVQVRSMQIMREVAGVETIEFRPETTKEFLSESLEKIFG